MATAGYRWRLRDIAAGHEIVWHRQAAIMLPLVENIFDLIHNTAVLLTVGFQIGEFFK
jgi:hypothetical protein